MREKPIAVIAADLGISESCLRNWLEQDGLTDLPPPRGPPEADMVEVLAASVPGTAEEIAETIHRSVADRLPVDQRVDDVALVVLRITALPSVDC